MDLTWCFPRPSYVRLGPREVLAGPLRLRDLARLQHYLKAARPCPLEASRAAIALAVPRSERWRRLLRDAYRACKSWPVRMGTPEAASIFDTPEGLRHWLAVALAEHNPGLAAADLEEILLGPGLDGVGGLTRAEYERLAALCHGADPLDELNRVIVPDCFAAPRGKKDPGPLNWGRLIAEVIEQTGWTFEQAGDLRVTQLAALRTRGEAGGSKVSPPPGMSPMAFSRRQKAFFGPDRDDVDLDQVEG